MWCKSCPVGLLSLLPDGRCLHVCMTLCNVQVGWEAAVIIVIVKPLSFLTGSVILWLLKIQKNCPCKWYFQCSNPSMMCTTYYAEKILFIHIVFSLHLTTKSNQYRKAIKPINMSDFPLIFILKKSHVTKSLKSPPILQFINKKRT